MPNMNAQGGWNLQGNMNNMSGVNMNGNMGM